MKITRKNTTVLISALGLMVSSFAIAQTSSIETVQAVSPPTIEAPAAQMDKTVASGVWTKKKFKSRGTWTVETKGGVTTVSLDEDFKTKNAPDLKILLSPLTVEEINSKNAINDSVLVSLLDSNKGAQSYVIPEGVDLSQYKSIVIHCELYTKLWSAAALN